jgi:hypothetical protein
MGSKRRILLPMLLGLALAGGVWYGVREWLLPRPLWVYEPVVESSDRVRLGISALSEDGRWMAVHAIDSRTQQAYKHVILDCQSGKPVPGVDLSKRWPDHNHGYIHCDKPWTLAEDCLWWFASDIVGNQVHLRLMCLPFLTTKQEQVVHRWQYPKDQFGQIRVIENNGLHVVLYLKTNLEHALRPLTAPGQDGMALLWSYRHAWDSSSLAQSWCIQSTGTGWECGQHRSYFRDHYEHWGSARQDHILYSNWNKLSAENMITGETLGEFTLPRINGFRGASTCHGPFLLIRRYFDFKNSDESYSSEFSPREFAHHPHATFAEYRLLYDRQTFRPIQWPTDLPREAVQDDNLQAILDQPDCYLHTSSRGTRGFFNKDWQLEFLVRKGDALQRQRSMTVQRAKAVAISRDGQQLYADRIRFVHEEYPRLSETLRKYSSLNQYTWLLPGLSSGLQVLSAETGETLFTIPNGYFHFENGDLHERMQEHGQMIVLRCNYPNMFPMQGHAFECWQMPFNLYSPWWRRGAGLVVFLAYLWCWRWRAITSKPHPK